MRQNFAVNTNVELVATTSATRKLVSPREDWHLSDPEFRSMRSMMQGNRGVL
jgi:hypothetical protein